MRSSAPATSMRGCTLPTCGTSTFTSLTTGCLTVSVSSCVAPFENSTLTRRYYSTQRQVSRVTYGRLCEQARKRTSSRRLASANLRRRSRACFLSLAKRFLRLGVRSLPPYEKSWQFDGWKTPSGWRRLNRNFCAPKRKYLETRRRSPSLRLEAQEAISRANGCRCFQKKCAASDVRTPRSAIEHERHLVREKPGL